MDLQKVGAQVLYVEPDGSVADGRAVVGSLRLHINDKLGHVTVRDDLFWIDGRVEAGGVGRYAEGVIVGYQHKVGRVYPVYGLAERNIKEQWPAIPQGPGGVPSSVHRDDDRRGGVPDGRYKEGGE